MFYSINLKPLENAEMHVKACEGKWKKEGLESYTLDKNINLLGFFTIDEWSVEKIESFKNDIESDLSPLVIDKRDVENLDFRLLNVRVGEIVYKDSRIESREWLRDTDGLLAVREEMVHVADDKDSSLLSKTFIKISWYREDGRVGLTKDITKYFNTLKEKRDEIRKVREYNINLLEEKVLTAIGKKEALVKLAEFKTERDLYLEGITVPLTEKIKGDVTLNALNEGFIT